MAEVENSGERRERIKRNQRLAFYSVIGAAGVAVGFTYSRFERDGKIWSDGNIPPTVAIVLAIVTVVAMLGGCLLLRRRIDEVERQHNLYAGAAASMAVLIGYPVWFLLWKGQWVPEPTHWALFLILYVVLVATYLIRKFR